MRLFVVFIIVISFHASGKNKYQFNIQSQSADKSLILFAQQANTTLLFPIELAAQEVTNN